MEANPNKDKGTFLNPVHSFARMILELIRRDRYAETLRILETLKRHFHKKRMWAFLAYQAKEEIGTDSPPGIGEKTMVELLSQEPPQRSYLGGHVRCLGKDWDEGIDQCPDKIRKNP